MSNENFNENEDPVEGTIPGVVRPKPSSNNGGILSDKVANSNTAQNPDNDTIEGREEIDKDLDGNEPA